MTRFLLTGLILLIGANLAAQQKVADSTAIRITAENYFYGYIERDLNKLNRAFDTVNGTMKVPQMKDGAIVSYQNKYFKEIMPIWGNREKLSQEILENCALKILNIDIVDGQIATARISMSVDQTEYIDILSLQKIEGLWKITNKIYVSRDR